MGNQRLRRLLAVAVAISVFVATAEAQNVTIRNDGIEFPDGTMQTTAADNGWIAAVQILQDQINAQQVTIATLQADLLAANDAIAALQADLTAAQQDIADMQSSTVFDLAPYVRVDQNNLESVAGPHVLFEGVNLHLRSGSGDTDLEVGLGNLIIGYNEWFTPYDRSGSHNLVLGKDFSFPDSTELLVNSGNRIILEGIGRLNLDGFDVDLVSRNLATLQAFDLNIQSDTNVDVQGSTIDIDASITLTTDGGVTNNVRGNIVDIEGRPFVHIN